MSATAAIDKSGRLVIPKQLRESLHLAPGTRLNVRQEGSALVLEPDRKPVRVSTKNGLPLIDLGYDLPPDHISWVEQNREDPLYEE